jgi:hypothetical protein
MILGAFDPVIQPHHVSSGQPALVDYYQVARFDKRPLQIPVHTGTDLPHERVTAARMHAGRQAGVTGEMGGGRKSIDADGRRVRKMADTRGTSSLRKVSAAVAVIHSVRSRFTGTQRKRPKRVGGTVSGCS